MKLSLDQWLAFTERYEGALPYLYLDVERLVTIGFGNLVDSVQALDGVAFAREDGLPATHMDVVNAWNTVKHDTTLDPKGGGVQYGKLTNIRATRDSIVKLCGQMVASNEAYLRTVFPDWDTWPADCQTATMSMCWAMGAHRINPHDYPHFILACKAANWSEAAAQCHMSEVGQTDSFKRRNLANAALFKGQA